MEKKPVDNSDLFDLIDFHALDSAYMVGLERYNPELSKRLAGLVAREIYDERRSHGKVISLDFYRIFGQTWSEYTATRKNREKLSPPVSPLKRGDGKLERR